MTTAPDLLSRSEPLLATWEVAARFRVTPEMVRCWTRAGKLPSVRVPTGRHRYQHRYPAAEIERLIAASAQHRQPAT